MYHPAVRHCALTMLVPVEEGFEGSLCAHAGVSLTGQPFNITVAWETVPRAGVLFRGHRSFGGYQMPQQRISVPYNTPGRAWS